MTSWTREPDALMALRHELGRYIEGSRADFPLGRDNLFEFDLENGRYEITVGVGRPARAYSGDLYNLSVEGQVLVDDVASTDAEPQIVATTEIDLTDGALSFEVGGRSATTGEFSYTFLAFIWIVALD